MKNILKVPTKKEMALYRKLLKALKPNDYIAMGMICLFNVIDELKVKNQYLTQKIKEFEIKSLK